MEGIGRRNIAKNKIFLELYEPYIVKGWKKHYFHYDELKQEYKALKKNSKPDIKRFDDWFTEEIENVERFVLILIDEISHDLTTVEKTDNTDHTIELFLRSIFEKCHRCKRFFDLNHYVICKTAKKFEKVLKNASCNESWTSITHLNESFALHAGTILELTNRCIAVYSQKYRTTYPALTFGELTFVKNRTKENSKTKFFIGLKLGLIAMMFIWILADSSTFPSTMYVWTQPGLYVYTIVGNLMLYRTCWAGNIHVWCKYNVNYMSIFKFEKGLKPNLLHVLDHSSSIMVLFFINLTLFFQFNMHPTSVSQYGSEATINFVKNGLPILLIGCVIAFEWYESYTFRSTGNETDRGLFSLPVLYGCLMTLCKESGVSYRESYVTNLGTTFTKIYSDFMHALCWVISGSFLISGQTVHNYGSDYMTCTGIEWEVAIAVLQIFPQVVRIAQQWRQYKDTGMKPYLINITKYMLTIIVIVYGLVDETLAGVYLSLVIILASFKWFWDCYMNWGVFENLSLSCGGENGYFLLRKQMMIPSPLLYYFCIVINFALRFAWVISLMPTTGSSAARHWGVFAGPRLSIFLGTLEIVRRSLWGLLRTEYEHIKFVNKKTPGYMMAPRTDFTPPITQKGTKFVKLVDLEAGTGGGGGGGGGGDEEGSGDNTPTEGGAAAATIAGRKHAKNMSSVAVDMIDENGRPNLVEIAKRNEYRKKMHQKLDEAVEHFNDTHERLTVRIYTGECTDLDNTAGGIFDGDGILQFLGKAFAPQRFGWQNIDAIDYYTAILKDLERKERRLIRDTKGNTKGNKDTDNITADVSGFDPIGDDVYGMPSMVVSAVETVNVNTMKAGTDTVAVSPTGSDSTNSSDSSDERTNGNKNDDCAHLDVDVSVDTVSPSDVSYIKADGSGGSGYVCVNGIGDSCAADDDDDDGDDVVVKQGGGEAHSRDNEKEE